MVAPQITKVAMALLSMVAGAIPAAAQTPAYPTRPVKLLLAFGPGGSADVIARMIGNKKDTRRGPRHRMVTIFRPSPRSAVRFL